MTSMIGQTLKKRYLSVASVGRGGLAGKVWGWGMDWYDAGYYYSAPPRNPPGPSFDADHVSGVELGMKLKGLSVLPSAIGIIRIIKITIAVSAAL